MTFKADLCSAAREEQEEHSWKGRDGRELTAQHSSQSGDVCFPSDPDPPSPAGSSSVPPTLALLLALYQPWAERAVLHFHGFIGTVWNQCIFKILPLTPTVSASSLLSFSPQHQLTTVYCAFKFFISFLPVSPYHNVYSAGREVWLSCSRCILSLEASRRCSGRSVAW